LSRVKTALGSLILPVVVGGTVFLSAGRWNLPVVWALLGVVAATSVLLAVLIDSSLVRERIQPGPGNRDRISRPVTILLLLAHWILAGLDVGRFHWSEIPRPLQIAGVAGYALSMGFLLWAVRMNPFYSSVVRIQTERGHHAIVNGPYGIVRHPGYAATLAGLVGGGLALGSWMAMIPVAAIVAVFTRRTLLEDRMLQADLPGYAEYAQKVRFRLIPGLF
jgi:protein-S-isoprenylcysteine O-methyltransferase Ste14